MSVSAPELASVGRSKVKDQSSKSCGFVLLYMYIFSVVYKRIASLGVTRQGRE